VNHTFFGSAHRACIFNMLKSDSSTSLYVRVVGAAPSVCSSCRRRCQQPRGTSTSTTIAMPAMRPWWKPFATLFQKKASRSTIMSLSLRLCAGKTICQSKANLTRGTAVRCRFCECGTESLMDDAYQHVNKACELLNEFPLRRGVYLRGYLSNPFEYILSRSKFKLF